MIGIIPTAGYATRIQGLPKFLLPVPGGYLLDKLGRRMRIMGASKILIGANQANFGLVERYAPVGASTYMVNTQTMSETVLALKRYAHTADVLFGMPDSYWLDEDVYPRLIADLNSGAMVSAALFETRPEQRTKLGMCAVQFVDDELHIRRVIDKPADTDLRLAWGAMAWRCDFWEFIKPDDPHVGYALQRAIDAKTVVRGSLMLGGYWDCGTADEYFNCIRHTTEAVYA